MGRFDAAKTRLGRQRSGLITVLLRRRSGRHAATAALIVESLEGAVREHQRAAAEAAACFSGRESPVALVVTAVVEAVAAGLISATSES
jgi:hypothetical protein